MSVGCEDFIFAAERILASDNSEIGWRVAAGRAYYGAFHCVRNLVHRQPAIKVSEFLGEHERYYQAVNALPLEFPGAKALKSLVYRAQQIRTIRTHADYELKTEFAKGRAEQAIIAAKTVHLLHRQFVVENNLP